MINVEECAKQSVHEAERGIEGTLPASDVEAAKQYVEDAIQIMNEQSGGYDPEVYGTGLAKSAVIAYAKARLRGADPQNNQNFVRTVDRWSRVAAAQYNNQNFD